MQWSSDKNAGFSTADITWLPVNQNYVTLNVEAQTQAVESHLKIYKELAKLRLHEDRVRSGDWDVATSGSMIGIARYIYKNSAILMIFNSSDKEATGHFLEMKPGETATVLFRSVGSTNMATVPGSEVDLATLTLDPFEAVVIDFKDN